MKKFTLGLIFLLVICLLLAGCGKNADNNTDKKSVIAEIQQTLNPDDTQVIIAFGDNFEAKKGLLQSSELHSEGLIALCINPAPLNLGSDTIQKWFKEAIERTELTAEQEVQIAKLGEFSYNRALLLRTNLSGDGLVAVCENPGSMNLGSDTVQKWFKEAIERTELTAEQEVQIAKLGKFSYNRALLFRTNLSGDGLVAVCENPGSMNLNSSTVQKWFKEAIERTELTEEQKVQIAKSKIKGLGLF